MVPIEDHLLTKAHFHQALCDIEVDDAKYPDEDAQPGPNPEPVQTSPAPTEMQHTQPTQPPQLASLEPASDAPKSRYATLATPAVRGLLKTHNVNILDVNGTGKDGRVLKEDVNKFIAMRDSAATTQPTAVSTPETERVVNLSPFQSQMFKTMSRSLSIPHFLYADELNINDVTTLRKKLASDPKDPQKITFLSFVIKAVSLALDRYPLLNAKVDTSNPDKPQLIMRPRHNIGVAVDTPNGLIVPNIKDVANRSILNIAMELSRLSALGKEGKLTPADLSGGTITVSNIGNIGGTYVMPVIVPNEVAILGVGKSRTTPIFDDVGQVTKGELVNFSWSADHRVVDGATMARMATKVRQFIESPELMLLNLR